MQSRPQALPTLQHQKPSAIGLTWAAIGAVSVVFVLYVLVGWVSGGVAQVVPGSDPMAPGKAIVMHVLEWGQFAVFVAILWHFVLRRLVRREALGFDGLFVLAAILLNFWDVLDNYSVFSFQYNAHQLNLGSWAGFIPGWRSPEPELWAVPIAFVFGAYTWAFFVAVRSGCQILSRVHLRHPDWAPWRGFAIVFASNAALCAVSENVYLRIGAFANIHPYEALTVWDGQPYAWPVYNPILFGLTWTAMTALRWYRDQDGLSFVERAIPEVVRSGRLQTLLRFFAIFAFLELTYILLYFLPWNAFALMRTVPPNIVPSYFPVPQ